jgi:hypothetical protein
MCAHKKRQYQEFACVHYLAECDIRPVQIMLDVYTQELHAKLGGGGENKRYGQGICDGGQQKHWKYRQAKESGAADDHISMQAKIRRDGYQHAQRIGSRQLLGAIIHAHHQAKLLPQTLPPRKSLWFFSRSLFIFHIQFLASFLKGRNSKFHALPKESEGGFLTIDTCPTLP